MLDELLSRDSGEKVARPTGLDHRFAEQCEARGDLEIVAAWPTREASWRARQDSNL